MKKIYIILVWSIISTFFSKEQDKKNIQWKKIYFYLDVLDNETSGVKLLYDKVPRTSHHKLPSPYLIDLER